MTAPQFPPWPISPPAYGRVLLRAVKFTDVAMVRELSTDAYVPLIGSLPGNADSAQARDWIARQHRKYPDGAGFSFTIADVQTGRPLGHCGLWLNALVTGRGSAGYSVRPTERGQGLAAQALTALTHFGWSIAELYRIELYIEPSNIGSMRTAEQAGYLREGLLRSHQEIGGARRDMLLYAATRKQHEASSD